jgi:hypothetical protein
MLKNCSKSRFARFRVLGSWDKKSLENFSSSDFELTNSLQLVTKFYHIFISTKLAEKSSQQQQQQQFEASFHLSSSFL